MSQNAPTGKNTDLGPNPSCQRRCASTDCVRQAGRKESPNSESAAGGRAQQWWHPELIAEERKVHLLLERFLRQSMVVLLNIHANCSSFALITSCLPGTLTIDALNLDMGDISCWRIITWWIFYPRSKIHPRELL